MISVTVSNAGSEPAATRHRRRRFGLDTPLPSDPAIIARAVRRHLVERCPDALALSLSPVAKDRSGGAVDVAAGVPDLLLLLPGGRAAFLVIKTQAQSLSRTERAFADLCRARAVPVHVVRSLPEARHVLDRLGLPTLPETSDAFEKGRFARRIASGPRPDRP